MTRPTPRRFAPAALVPAALALLTVGFAPAASFADEKNAEQADARPAIEKANVAHIKLSGAFPEAPQPEGPFGALTQTLEKAKDRIEKAAADDRISAVLLEIDDPEAGFTKARSLRASIKTVRDAGKPVYAYFEDASTPGYLIACAADKVIAPESGGVMMVGLRAEVEFYKELFDDFEVQPDMLRVGKFKSAAEPYTRSSMSPEFREELTEVLGDIYENVLVTVAETRGMEKDAVDAAIDSGPHTANGAKAAGLIDEILYEDQIADLIKKELNAGEVRIVEDYLKPKPKKYEGFSGLMELLNDLSGETQSTASRGPKIAVIYALGPIISGKSVESPFTGAQSMGSDTMIKAIDEAREDDTVKAVVLRVDSPGGSALASDLMWRALVRLKAEKPLIVSMGEVAGSGGYYIAMPGDTILADPSTITGSIGVVGGKLAFGETFKRFGVTHDVVQFGDNAGTLSLLTPFDESEEAAMRKMLAEIYELFTKKAAEGRNMELERLKELAGGRIYSGARAKELGLVDELGTLEDAIALAEKAAAERHDDVDEGDELGRLNLPKPVNPFEALFENGMPGMLKAQQAAAGEAAVAAAVEALPEPLSGVAARLGALETLAKERALVVMPFGLTVK
ncbi:signal peptide peptidase SppA [Alienimonas sp. DA493]|uniref:signal peptide peptidase SppA n=1 Tax=Alienimonas sp. DA493 TaxID=3373605 RepID=UPI0037546A48